MTEDAPSNPLQNANIPHFLLGRAGDAIASLIASSADIPKARLERVAQGIRDGTEARSIVSRAVATEVGKRAALDEAVIDRAVGSLLAREYRTQENRESIAQKTVELLSGPSEDESVTEGEVDKDWLNIFEQYAGMASTERLQDIWARVLAGEIRKPKSFSPKTLRFVSELDQKVASTFEKHSRSIVDLPAGFIPKPHQLSGQDLFELLLLEDFGLITGTLGDLSRKLTLHETHGKRLLKYRTHAVGIVGKPGTKIDYPLVLLTTVGREIASILRPQDDIECAKMFAKVCPKGNVEKIIYGRMTTGKEGWIHLSDEVVLWEKDLTPTKAGDSSTS